MGWSGRLCILVFTWVRVPPVSRGPTDNGRPSGFQAWSPLWVFTGPFWKHTGWCLNRDPQRGELQQPPLSASFYLSWSSFLHSCPVILKISCLCLLSFVVGSFVLYFCVANCSCKSLPTLWARQSTSALKCTAHTAWDYSLGLLSGVGF